MVEAVEETVISSDSDEESPSTATSTVISSPGGVWAHFRVLCYCDSNGSGETSETHERRPECLRPVCFSLVICFSLCHLLLFTSVCVSLSCFRTLAPAHFAGNSLLCSMPYLYDKAFTLQYRSFENGKETKTRCIQVLREYVGNAYSSSVFS
jgi:hypothetical protein